MHSLYSQMSSSFSFIIEQCFLLLYLLFYYTQHLHLYIIMSTRSVYRTCAQVAPSGECLWSYKPRAAHCSRLAPRVAASCLAKPSCYTWPARPYSLCCPAWQLVCVYMHCIDLFSCKAASVFTINLLYFLTLLICLF